MLLNAWSTDKVRWCWAYPDGDPPQKGEFRGYVLRTAVYDGSSEATKEIFSQVEDLVEAMRALNPVWFRPHRAILFNQYDVAMYNATHGVLWKGRPAQLVDYTRPPPAHQPELGLEGT